MNTFQIGDRVKAKYHDNSPVMRVVRVWEYSDTDRHIDAEWFSDDGNHYYHEFPIDALTLVARADDSERSTNQTPVLCAGTYVQSDWPTSRATSCLACRHDSRIGHDEDCHDYGQHGRRNGMLEYEIKRAIDAINRSKLRGITPEIDRARGILTALLPRGLAADAANADEQVVP